MPTRRTFIGGLATLAVLAAAVGLAAPAAHAAFSGADGKIVFVSDRTGSRQLYSMNYDGSDVIQLTTTGNNFDPNVSSDGTSIVFVSDRDGSNEIYTMPSFGGTQTRVTTNTLIESHPVWAPKPTVIAFAAINPSTGDSDIYTVKPNGANLIDLTNSPTAFDADPAWSPGGQTIAFDRTDSTGATNVYTMAKEGTNQTQITTTGTDSNPNWASDNKNLAFQSARDVEVPGPTLFTGVQKPDSILALSTKLLVTQFNKDKILQVNSSGTSSTWVFLPSTGNSSVERYLALSPGANGWPAGEVYATVGPNIYQIAPDGSSVSLFVNIPSLPNGETSITFDTVGTFGFNMVLTDRRGPVWMVTPAGVATQICDFGRQIEGVEVAPTSWVPYGGQLIGGNEFSSQVYAMSYDIGTNTCGQPTPVGSWPTPEGAVFVPTTVCNMTGTTGAYFVAMKDQNQIFKFPASQFTGLSSQALVPDEETTTIGLFATDGTGIRISQFWPAIGTPELEGSDFVHCGTAHTAPTSRLSRGALLDSLGQAALRNPAAAAYAALTAGPHEIYKMNQTGGGLVRLTNNTTDDINPAWSPSDATIVFQSDRDDPNEPTCEASATCKYEIYTMSATDGSGQVNITNNLTANDASPDWQAAGYTVTISDFAFTPSIAKPKEGGSVLWNNVGPSTHTVTDTSGMGLFDSGDIGNGGYYLFAFQAAGKYPYYCSIHPQMTGTVSVPMTAVPKTGTTSTTFTITWAAIAQKGYVYDVQIQRPGTSGFVDWLTATTLKSQTFVPDAGPGTYSWQARLRNLTGQSNYSAVVSVTVTA